MRRLVADLAAGEPIRLPAALAAGKKVAPDATGLLADDHRTVLGWFRWYKETSDVGVRSHLIDRICAALKAHMAAEEEFLYPALDRRGAAPQLAQRAFTEHAYAKSIIEQLEQSPDEAAAVEGLVAKLEREIAAHVAEEEAELFPAARRVDIDLYELGRQIAARRAQMLRKHRSRAAPGGVEQHEESTTMYVSPDDARHFLIVGLKNAHAMIRHGRTLVTQGLERLESYPDMQEKLAQHARDKDAQLMRIERLLDAYGESPSKTKDAAMAMAAGVSGLSSSAAADEVVNSSFATLAQAKYEAAAFETLLVFAEAAGEASALRPLQQALSESRGLAAFCEEHVRPTAIRFLALRGEGKQAKR